MHIPNMHLASFYHNYVMYFLGVVRFIDASMNRDTFTFPAIRIAILFFIITIFF